METIQARRQTGVFSKYAISPEAKAKLGRSVSATKAWAAIISAAGVAIAAIISAAATSQPKPVDRRSDSVVQALAARADIADAQRSDLIVRTGSLEKRVDRIESKLDASIYISCELLRLQQPRAIQLSECRDAARRRGP